jgi:hypothetical protein
MSQLSLWMGAVHPYGQMNSESLVSGGPLPAGRGFRGAASTSCGAHGASTAELGGGGHSSHESASDPQRPET